MESNMLPVVSTHFPEHSRHLKPDRKVPNWISWWTTSFFTRFYLESRAKGWQTKITTCRRSERLWKVKGESALKKPRTGPQPWESHQSFLVNNLEMEGYWVKHRKICGKMEKLDVICRCGRPIRVKNWSWPHWNDGSWIRGKSLLKKNKLFMSVNH